MLTLYKVTKIYTSSDTIDYVVLPYNFLGHLKCCIKWYGLRGLKNTYLNKKHADRVAAKLKKKEN